MQDAFDFSEPEDSPPPRGDTAGPVEGWSLQTTLDAIGTGQAVVATVNQRLSRHLTALYSRHRVAAGDTWWDTPQILPLSSWMTQLHDEAIASGASDRARLAPLAARLRWRQAVESSHARLLDVDAAAREAMRAWRLAHTWQCLPDADERLSDDAYAWRGWAAHYQARLNADAMVDEATLPSHIGTIAASLQLPATLVLAGFLRPTPQLLALRDIFEACGVQVRRLDTADPCEPRCVCWRDDTAELAAVASSLRQRLEARPGAVLGLVVPDLERRRASVRRALDQVFFPGQSPADIDHIGRPYDLSAGLPLVDLPVARTAMDILTLAWRGLDRHGVARLLLSPNLRGASEEAGRREALEQNFRTWRVRHCTLSSVQKKLHEQSVLRAPLKKLQQRIDKARREDGGKAAATRTLWADRFSEALAAFGWPGDNLSSDEYQAVQAVHGLLDDVQSLDDGESLSAGAMLSDVLRLAAERVFQAQTADLPIRVLGRLESHGQHFDALWVIGLDSEQWPAQGNPTPFLSMLAQREAGMPEASPEARMALAHTEYEHWCASAPEVTVSCSQERDDKPLVPAAVMHDIAIGVHEAANPVVEVKAVVRQERIDDPCGPPTRSGEIVRGGTRLLEDQAACPFRAFARHRLQIRALEEPEQGLDARQRGSFLHRALEFFWTRTRSKQALMDLDEPALAAAVQQAVDEALAEDSFIDAAIARLESVRLSALVHEWLAGVEMNRQDFTVEAFEQKTEFEHAGVSVRLTLDRIDRIGDSLVVIDYKSGRSDGTQSWAEARIGNPQLPLYALTRDDLKGVAFARVVRGACGFRGIAASDELLQSVGPGDPPRDWEDWRGHWRDALDTVAAEVAEGFAVALPGKQTCLHCDLGGLCRVNAADIADEEEEPS